MCDHDEVHVVGLSFRRRALWYLKGKKKIERIGHCFMVGVPQVLVLRITYGRYLMAFVSQVSQNFTLLHPTPINLELNISLTYKANN
jgi:hypothetical protein